MNRITEAYTYLLEMVNKRIHLCLYTKYHFEEEIRLNSHLDSSHFKFNKLIIAREKKELKELKKLNAF